MRMTSAKRPSRLPFIIVTIVLLLVTLFPVYWVVRMSFTPNKQIMSEGATLFPSRLTATNYLRVLGFIDSATAVKLGGSGQKINFLRFLFNSIFVSTVVTLSMVLFSAAGAYAFARLRFPGRKAIFNLYISALMVPTIVMMIPNFILVKNLGWLNSYMGIMAPSLLMTPYAVFFLRQFFLGINRELEEAAFIDGAGKLRIFFGIIVPISVTSLTTLAVISFVGQWNDYMWPLIVGKDEKVRLLTVALGVFRSQTPQGNPDWGGLMAGTTLAIVPTLILFLVFGRKIVNSINFSGFR
jgi:multiple sugar transport system permease protein